MHLSRSCLNGGEGGHTRGIDIEASPVTGAAELLLTQGSRQGPAFWHFQQRRTGRKNSPERDRYFMYGTYIVPTFHTF